MAKEVLIRYNIEDIFNCRKDNNLMTNGLEEYCNNNYNYDKIYLEELFNVMDDITKSHLQGINPNDIALKNTIRDNLNKINNNNYVLILENLKTLNYSSENHFRLLATEIIMKCMNDVLACKGIDTTRQNKTPSEIYIDVASEFSVYFIKNDDDEEIKFRDILMSECEKFFKTFTNKSDSMDQHNPHRVSNYKGLLNMLGLMYSNNLLPCKIICSCLGKITRLILDKKIKQEECDNYYSGYERLINRLLCYYENYDESYDKDDFKKIKAYIKKTNNKILEACNSDNKPLRVFSIIVHKKNIKRYENVFSK